MSVEAEIIYGDIPFVTDGPELSYTGLGELDSMSVEVLANWSTWQAELASLGYTRHATVSGYGGMWVEQLTPRKSGSLVTVSVQAIGLLSGGDKRRRRTSCAGQEISVGPIEKVVLVWDANERGEDEGAPVERVKRRVTKLDDDGEPEYEVIVTPSGSFDRWDIGQAIVTVSDTYFSTTEPASSDAGTANAPPSPPATPPYIWSGYGEAMRARHPNGWVLETREVDKMFSGLFAVTDSWAYYYPAMPD